MGSRYGVLLKTNRNTFHSGFCLECYTKTMVIRFKGKPTCRKCLVQYDDSLAVEDYIFTTDNCVNYSRGEFIKATRRGSLPV